MSSRKRDSSDLSTPAKEELQQQGDARRQRVTPPSPSSSQDHRRLKEEQVQEKAAADAEDDDEHSSSKKVKQANHPHPDSKHIVDNRWVAFMRMCIQDKSFSPRYRMHPEGFFKMLDIIRPELGVDSRAFAFRRPRLLQQDRQQLQL